MKYLSLLSPLFFCLLMACTTSQKNHLHKKQIPLHKKDTTGQIQTHEVYLALEYCQTGYDFCNDGVFSFYRISPFLVKLNPKHFERAYADTLFNLYSYEKNADTTFYKNQLKWLSHDPFKDKISTANLVSVCLADSLTDRINKNLVSRKIPNKFDGKLYYSLFKVRMSYVYKGAVEISLPWLEVDKSGKTTRHSQISHVFQIRDITTITPVSLKEYRAHTRHR